MNDTTEIVGSTNFPHGQGYPGPRNEDFEEVYQNYATKYPAYLNIFDHTRCYGGPEEGGWYFTRGELLESPILVFSEEEAAKIALKKFEDGYNTDGKLVMDVCDDKGENFPKEYPHYE